MELARMLAEMHPLLVHFPIVLILLGVAYDGLYLLRRDARTGWAGQWLTVLGTAALLVTFICGILAEVFAARSGMPQGPIESHERLATAAAWLFIALAAGRLFLGTAPRRRRLAIYLAIAVFGCALLALAAHRGGHVVYEYGANVAGVSPLHGPSDEDLATVAQHQTQASLDYSNRMHHIFGWLVLALALAVFAERLRLGRLERLRGLMPLIFIGGGVFLFIYSDWDSWPLSNLRPITDAEVLLHKSIAVVLMSVGGLALLRRRRAGGGDATREAVQELAVREQNENSIPSASTNCQSAMHPVDARNPQSAIEKSDIPNPKSQIIPRSRWAWQNKLIAAVALAGGGALFTHVHTNAPYTTNAIGVYLNHAALGLTALAVGGAVLLANLHPGRRWVALLFPAALLLEAVLLLQYDENLPWFLGYHSIGATPPRGGVLAQAPGGRAEMTFDLAHGNLDVYFWQARQAIPRTVAAERLDGVLEAQNRQVAVALTAAPGQPAGRYQHFQAEAPWLRDTSLFMLRLAVPAGEGKRPWTVEFDPWVTAPIMPPLIGAQTVYACPMCRDVLSTRPGHCPICGMTLAIIPPSSLRPASFWSNELIRPRPPMHDAKFRMQFATAPATPVAGRPTTLEFRLLDAATGETVKNFQTVHTKLLHLIIVSRDLAWFDHVHPELQPDGRFLLTENFPHGGEFLLYPDLTPAGAGSQVFRLPCRVADAPPSAEAAPANVVLADAPMTREAPAEAPLMENQTLTRTFGEYQVSLLLTPTPATTADETQLTFTIARDGRPVDDLGLFLGATGHCVIIHQDTQTFVHTHPLPLTAAVPPPAGPTVTFHAFLPRRGLYKAWGQFMYHGQVITADFVFRVR